MESSPCSTGREPRPMPRLSGGSRKSPLEKGGSPIYVLGAGHFGSRASRILSKNLSHSLTVVDARAEAFAPLEGLAIKRVHRDAVEYLVSETSRLDPETLLVPAVPFHLAFAWLEARLEGRCRLAKIPFPQETGVSLPHTWLGSEGSLLVSYADFRCPDDCPEPEACTVTGEKRDLPLYALLRQIRPPGFRVHVIRSRQLAPGVGGYRLKDLLEAETYLRPWDGEEGILGTACRCHGIVTAFSVTGCKVAEEA